MKRLIITVIYTVIFMIAPLTSADLRMDRVHGFFIVNKEMAWKINWFDELLKKFYFGSWISSSFSAKSLAAIKNGIVATLKGKEAGTLLRVLEDGDGIHFEKTRDRQTGEPIINIYTSSKNGLSQ